MRVKIIQKVLYLKFFKKCALYLIEFLHPKESLNLKNAGECFSERDPSRPCGMCCLKGIEGQPRKITTGM